MEEEFFVISIAANLAGMHAQTLRTYDRLGLVKPQRTPGGGRRYTQADVDRLLQIQQLSQEEGINLSGIKRIIELENQISALHNRINDLEKQLTNHHQNNIRNKIGKELALMPKTTTVVLWERKNRKNRFS